MLADIYKAMLDGTATIPEPIATQLRRAHDPILRLDDGTILLRVYSPERGPDFEDVLGPLPPAGVTYTIETEGCFSFRDITMPTLGSAFYIEDVEGLVVQLPSGIYEVRHRPIHMQGMDPLDLDGNILVLTPTDKRPTVGNRPAPEHGYRSFHAQVFGQPHFNQASYFPSFEGRSAYVLYSRDSYIGDAGIENMFIALDEEGNPARAWLEQSSC